MSVKNHLSFCNFPLEELLQYIYPFLHTWVISIFLSFSNGTTSCQWIPLKFKWMISERRVDNLWERTQKSSVRKKTKLSRKIGEQWNFERFDHDKEIVNSYCLNVGDNIVSQKRKLSFIFLKREITKYKVIKWLRFSWWRYYWFLQGLIT